LLLGCLGFHCTAILLSTFPPSALAVFTSPAVSVSSSALSSSVNSSAAASSAALLAACSFFSCYLARFYLSSSALCQVSTTLSTTISSTKK
jgi:hypothetical protein